MPERTLKVKKKNVYTLIVVIFGFSLVAAFIYFNSFVNSNPQGNVSASLAKCIGQNSHVYVQLGCSHCANQEAMFGNNWEYINSTDCYYNSQECITKNITGTPTWIINGQYYLGTQTIETLKSLTGC